MNLNLCLQKKSRLHNYAIEDLYKTLHDGEKFKCMVLMSMKPSTKIVKFTKQFSVLCMK